MNSGVGTVFLDDGVELKDVFPVIFTRYTLISVGVAAAILLRHLLKWI